MKNKLLLRTIFIKTDLAFDEVTRAVVVIPTYNEKPNIIRLIKEVKKAVSDTEIEISFVIVDDNSPDGTANAVRQMISEDSNIHLITRPGKMGLGSAYIEAFRYVLNSPVPFDVVIQMDADFSHPPQLIKDMVNTIKLGDADVVIGSRYLKGGSSKNWPIYRKIISKGANILANTLLNTKIKDVTSGYRAFSYSVLRRLSLDSIHSKGYEYQIETLYSFVRMKIKIKEIPFLFNNRVNGKSKLSGKDIREFLQIVLSMRLKSLVYNNELLANN